MKVNIAMAYLLQKKEHFKWTHRRKQEITISYVTYFKLKIYLDNMAANM